MNKHDYFEIPIADVAQETGDAVSITLDIPAGLTELFAYKPGQFVTLRIRVAGKLRHRCYSLSSAPETDARHRIAVKRVEGGLVSNFVCSALKTGQTILLQPPAGMFVPASLDSDFLFFAGGSGITPILSILKSALAGGTGHSTLVYANRDEASVIYRDELAQLVQARPDRLTVHHWLESLQGLPSADHLAAVARGRMGAQAFICGPERFMAAAVAAAQSIGIARDHVHVETFVSLPDEDEPTIPSQVAPDGVELTVTIDGEEHRFDWPRGKRLLDAMLDVGLDAPFSCRAGGCGACMCRLVEGEVMMAKNLILGEEEIAEGWTLACQALPASAKIRVDIP